MANVKTTPVPAARSGHALASFMLAVTSGVFAAVTALAGKLASGGFESKIEVNANLALAHSLPSPDTSFIIRMSYLGILVASNVAMWASFSKALALSESSQEPQGINTAANLFTSGCLGLLVFGENLPMLWWGGMALITVGIALVRREPTNINPDTHSWDTDAQGKVPGKAD